MRSGRRVRHRGSRPGARWAVPNASITYTSHSAAMRRASASSSAFSPSRKRTFSQSTISPGSTSRPSSQSSASRTWHPSSSPRRRATGASECRGSGLPSFGRPRCDITITRAPARAACRNVGTAARSRASLVTSPSLTGTFRSSRMSTRRPARSRSVMARTFTGHVFRRCNRVRRGPGCGLSPMLRFVAESVRRCRCACEWRFAVRPGQAAFISATVVSSIRFEKPHSLSYHATTLTRRPSMTRVSLES